MQEFGLVNGLIIRSNERQGIFFYEAEVNMIQLKYIFIKHMNCRLYSRGVHRLNVEQQNINGKYMRTMQNMIVLGFFLWQTFATKKPRQSHHFLPEF